MTYREIIELYKNGKLDVEQRERVEKDIERQEAISEYLFDKEEIPDLNELKETIIEEQNTAGNTANGDDEAQRFTKMIRSSIRRAFIKMGAVVAAIILIIVLVIVYVVPESVNEYYYDPGEIAGETEDGYKTNRISLDFATYTELFVPGYYRWRVESYEKGMGEYVIDIRQTSSYTGEFTNIAGQIEKNYMLLYDTNRLKRPAGNAFVWNLAGVDGDYIDGGVWGEFKDIQKYLDDLDEQDYYTTYITLDKVMKYDEFSEWNEANKADATWCAVCEKTERGYYARENVGFIYSSSAGQIYYDKEKYPYLSYFDATLECGEDDNWVIPEDIMQQHMVSMLRYMNEQEEFCEMMGYSGEAGYLSELADNIDSNGLNIYGFVSILKKSEIVEMSKLDDVAYIYAEKLR